jgi:hypothetical protein
MRKVVAAAFVSLDSIMQAPGGPRGGRHGRLHPWRVDGQLLGRADGEPLTWTNSVALHGDVAAEIARLKQEDGPNLLTQGSSILLQTLLAHDLIDEFRLLIFPLVLGPGKRLFGQGTKPGALKLTATTVSTTGVIMSVYDRAGAISTGSFERQPPSEAEIARQERMKREG